MQAVGTNELWPLAMSEVGTLDGAVIGCQESETDGVVRLDVEDVGSMAG